MGLKKLLTASLVVVFTMLLVIPAKALPVEISGRLKIFLSAYLTDNPDGEFFTHESGAFALRRLEARLLFAGSLNHGISYRVRIDAFANAGDPIDTAGFAEAGILGIPLLSEYLEMNLYEGMVKVSDFLIKNLDLTVGKQRISWGTADRVGVVDNLNPIDLANFFTFDPDHAFERRPQTAINLEYYLGDVSRIQLVWLLQHQISPLPFGYTFLLQQGSGLDAISVENGWEDKILDTGFGIRLTTTIFKLDMGLSYYNGNAPVPVMQSLFLQEQTRGTFLYPRQQIWGWDLSGEIQGMGFWAEVALIIPQKITSELSMMMEIEGVPQPVNQEFPLFEQHYLKYVAGVDYNFGGGFYANLQFVHGFFDEFDFSPEAERLFSLRKGMFFGELENFLIGQLQYTGSRNNLKLSVNYIYEMADSQSLILLPALELKISDVLLIQAGAFLPVSGDRESTKFGLLRDDKLAYLGFRLDF